MRHQSRLKALLRIPGFQTMIASILCILLGLFVGYLVLMIISPGDEWPAISSVIKNFMTRKSAKLQMKSFATSLVKTVPLLMCGLSVLFAYKVGLFNIGAAGQYVAGIGASLFCALGLKAPWPVCVLAAILAGAVVGSISGFLKATRNVNEVISCIMLNWISLYLVNMLLAPFQDIKNSETFGLVSPENGNTSAIIPSLGLEKLFGNYQYITIAVPISVIIAILLWIFITKTKLGYELRATGLNKHAAKYAGMQDRKNIILTMAISGALAGLGAAMLYLTDIQRWPSTVTAVPGMGFNGIAAAFLGGLHPIGTVFASYFIQHITDGGQYVNLKIYPSEISSLISAVIIYACAFVLFFKQKMNKILDHSSPNAKHKKEQEVARQ